MRNFKITLTILSALVWLGFSQQTKAQQASGDLTEDFKNAAKLLRSNQFAKAQNYYNVLINHYKEEAKERYGPKFGILFRNRGLCELQLRKYPQAAESFRACHEDYANTPKTKDFKKNPYAETSLVYWGISEYLAKNAQLAFDKFKKFEGIVAQKKDLNYNESLYFLNFCLAACKINRLDKAKTLLDTMFTRMNEIGMNTEQIFQASVEYIESSTRAGQADKALAFIDKRLKNFDMPAYEMHSKGFASRFVKLAQESMMQIQKTDNAKTPIYVALVNKLCALYKPASEALAYLENIKKTRGASPKLNAEIKKYQELATGKKSIDVVANYMLLQTFAGIKAVYAQKALSKYLVENYPQSEHLPFFLYFLVGSSASTGDFATAEKYGEQFLKKFPNHKLTDAVSQNMLGSLFKKGDFDKCIEIAGKVRQKSSPGAQERELPDLYYASSLYRLGRKEEARGELQAFVDNYPNSKQLDSVMYYQASNELRFLNYDSAKKMLDEFLQKYPNSVFRSYALYDRALVHYMNSEFDESIAKLKEVNALTTDPMQKARALSLRGDCLASRNDNSAAAESYLESLGIADKNGLKIISQSLLSKLVSTYANLGENKKALSFYDKYFAEHRGGEYDAKIAVYGIKPAIKENRSDEIFTNLEKVIVDLSSRPQARDLEVAVDSYVERLDKEKGKAEVIKRLENFPGAKGAGNNLQALLSVALIDAMDEELKMIKDNKDSRKVSLRGRKNAQINRLLSEFRNANLSNYGLLKKGQILQKQKQSSAALKTFSALEARNGKYSDYATFERAKELARSADAADQTEAEKLFIKLIEVLDSETSPESHMELARLYQKLSQWKKSLKHWGIYKKTGTGNSYTKAEAGFGEGLALENLGDFEKAAKTYTATAGNFVGVLKYSGQCYLRAASIIESKLGSKPKAYNLAKAATDLYKRSKLVDSPEDETGSVKKLIKMTERLKNELNIQDEKK